MSKPELEFFDTGQVGWEADPRGIPGLFMKVLSRDEATGDFSSMQKLDPGCDMRAAGVQRHPFWEEVYIVSGSLSDLTLNQEFAAGHYACRPPGMPHGPFGSQAGCITFQVCYHSGAAAGAGDRSPKLDMRRPRSWSTDWSPDLVR
jgi:hypothetical protein